MTPRPPRWSSAEERDALARAAATGEPSRPPAAEEPVPAGLSRRGFLAAVGFSAGALAACARAPERVTAAPGEAPEHAPSGGARWFSTTCGACPAGCGLLVKTKDGRPIKVEGNPAHPVSRGGVCAVGQASVLSLYDSRRLRSPRVDGRDTDLAAADAAVRKAVASGGAVRVLTATVTSPSTRAAVARWLAGVPDGRHVEVDPLSASAALAAHEAAFGVRALPRVRLERAEAVLAVDCDVLGTWVSPVEHTRGWAAARDLGAPTPRLSWHGQAESVLTLSGSNADRRVRVSPGDVPALVAHLVHRVAQRTGGAAPSPADPCPVAEDFVEDAVRRLVEHKGRSVLLCGTNDLDVQRLVLLANERLGAYGGVLDLAAPSLQRRGDDAAWAALLDELDAGKVATLVVAGVNPVVELPAGRRFAAAAAKVPVRVVVAERPDETVALATVAVPAPHFLEAFDDAEPVAGVVSLSQPTVQPLVRARTLRACVAAWTGAPEPDLDLVRAHFEREVAPKQAADASPGRAFRRALRDGFVETAPAAPAAPVLRGDAVPATAPRAKPPAAGRLVVALFPSVALLDGRHAWNPWLQELPDPVTKQTWGNAACIAPETAAALGAKDGDVLRLSGDDGTAIELPAVVVPGTARGTVGVALGHGRLGTERFERVGPRWLEARPTTGRDGRVGTDASAFLALVGGLARPSGAEVRVERTGATDVVARTQTWSSLTMPTATAPHGGERRDPVRETTLAAWKADPRAGNPAAHHGPGLWEGLRAAGPRWGLVVDLTKCTGCSACVVACQAENNVPVVGRDEVARGRDMAWLRVDRYFADVEGAPGEVEVVHQPLPCQHCGNAPCEVVCPVLATSHSEDGRNEQTYNRCVGTRYCANNCPYKVRRFNWFGYGSHDTWADLVLNPDVTVRERGVMEKCSFCVQRVSEAKAEARREGRALADGDVRTACQQSCPAGALVFGDVTDATSAAARAAKDPRRYRVLEELNVDPAVSYLVKVRERPLDGAPKEGPHHG